MGVPGQGAAARPKSVAIAVLTYKRPEHAASVVPALDAALSELDDGRALRLIVVDNDPDASARPVVAAGAAGALHRVSYVHEPAPGIAAARNRALAECDEDAIVFIDDDERPRSGWLPALVSQWERAGAEAVAGPVVPDFSRQPDSWILAGGWFNHGRRASGTPMPAAATNNLLLDMAFLRSNGLRFDLDFGMSGGEDTLLTRQLVQAGGRIVWCDEAVVADQLPAERLTREWVRRRAFWSGNSWAAVDIRLAAPGGPRLTARMRQLARGGVRVAGGMAKMLAAGAKRDEAAQSRAVRVYERGRGMCAGALGRRWMPYRRD
ncbi:glycosyl transferase family 2 [Actinomyces sp. 432]|uniref:glycosyltransferase family 2 protein n=1 Tax=unclassified Actinomyces TaxID=2609248 RepID=UPI001373C56C|nr:MULTISPECIES: glycosyltransferase [unclassified Actinomyces]MBW3069449.1 glycosyltransferase [Actinomyces sp. 594]QHO90442.1 glycosyl transferase family 2 [Actinomyces sp. 432]